MNLNNISKVRRNSLYDLIPFEYKRFYEDEGYSLIQEKSIENELSMRYFKELMLNSKYSRGLFWINISSWMRNDDDMEYENMDEKLKNELLQNHPLELYLDKNCTHTTSHTIIDSFRIKESFTTIEDCIFHEKRYQVLLNDFNMKLKTVKNKRSIINIQDLQFDLIMMEEDYAWYKH